MFHIPGCQSVQLYPDIFRCYVRFVKIPERNVSIITLQFKQHEQLYIIRNAKEILIISRVFLLSAKKQFTHRGDYGRGSPARI